MVKPIVRAAPPVVAIPRRAVGAGYNGRRESGYDEAAMDELRAQGDQAFFMLNVLKIVDLESWNAYTAAVDAKFREIGAENVYSGLLRDACVYAAVGKICG